MKYFTALLLFSLAVSIGCDGADSTVADPVVYVEDDNDAMEAAKIKAKGTLSKFIMKWEQDPVPGGCSVKIGVKTIDDDLEHIWFEPLNFTEAEFTGICANDPAKVANLKLGDKRTFPRNAISDWMILDGDTCYGGYTIRVLSEMEPENAPPFVFKDL